MQNIKDLYIFLDLRALRAELANKLFYLQQTWPFYGTTVPHCVFLICHLGNLQSSLCYPVLRKTKTLQFFFPL